MTKKVLLAGESWVSAATHYKGFDQFGSVTFHLGAEPLVKALAGSPFELTYMPAHEAATAFPLTLEDLQAYDALILSDLGANTLLLHPDVWLHGKTVPNRLKLIEAYVAGGGGLAMIGGYFSFQGINGAARWHRTPVETTLPVRCLPVDDRIEVPEGFAAELIEPTHPILAGLDQPWPALLGLNEVTLAPNATLLARTPAEQGGHPLLAVGTHGQGRTLAWTSDIGPHWLPQPFVDWPGYARLWRQALGWLTTR
ncbi:MAG: glutamine amidotransferase [Pseudomonadota bacterium]